MAYVELCVPGPDEKLPTKLSSHHVGTRFLRSQIRKHRRRQGPDDRHESQMHLPLPVCGVERTGKEASVLIVLGWNLSRKRFISLNRNPEVPIKEGDSQHRLSALSI